MQDSKMTDEVAGVDISGLDMTDWKVWDWKITDGQWRTENEGQYLLDVTSALSKCRAVIKEQSFQHRVRYSNCINERYYQSNSTIIS